MSNRAYDKHLARENYVHEVACVECGFHRNGRHHPKIKCPRTGRCGECGNDWPCEEHKPARVDSVSGDSVGLGYMQRRGAS